MPLTDSLGQGIPYAAQTDSPIAQVLGGGIVEAVAPKLVMQFNSAGHRGAVVTSPTAGMVAWLRDVRLLQIYDGSQWVTVATGATAWQTPALASGWTQGASDAPDFQFRQVSLFGEPTIMFRGCVSRETYPTTVPNSWLTLVNPGGIPVSARPSGLRRMVVACSGVNSTQTVIRMDVRPEGEIRIYDLTSGVRPPWISFDGVYCSL